MKDEKYMGAAIELAARSVNPGPNPYVGAVIVKNGRITGKGFHLRAGMPHAEANAIRMAGLSAKGAALYVNLEPCAHYGRTPPCSGAIIKSGIRKAIIGMKDPNPLVSGKGIKELKKAGIEVITGVLERESARLNEKYVKYMTTGMPFTLLKSAVSLDGKICANTGDSKWISSEGSRDYARRLRAKFDAVLVGVNTVLKDDPEIVSSNKCQVSSQKIPYKIVVDSRLRIPLKAKILKRPEEVIIATTKKALKSKARLLEKLGVKILAVKEKNGKVDLKALMKELAGMEITSVFIEGGGEINASALGSGIVDKVLFFIAPKIIGGRNAKTAVEGNGILRVARAIPVRDISVSRIGGDVVVEGYIK